MPTFNPFIQRTLQAVSRQAAGYAFVARDLVAATKAFVLTVLIYVATHPQVVEAGDISRSICRTYRRLVDNELFLALSLVAAVIVLIVWKSGQSAGVMAKAVGVLAALTVALQLENIINTTTGLTVCP